MWKRNNNSINKLLNGKNGQNHIQNPFYLVPRTNATVLGQEPLSSMVTATSGTIGQLSVSLCHDH